MPYSDFQQIVRDYFAKHGRALPWRRPEADGSFDPYKILISEVMLQQTQVARVIPKYQEFLQAFPTVQSLAASPLGEVLRIWSGLGYNRRAKYLHDAVKQLATKKSFWELTDLLACKGIGPNTAAAVIVYTYNQPLVFIETNIRTVYIHHFFADQTDISDAQLLPIIATTLDQKNAQEWYWALMDYGSHLKLTTGNAGRASKHYAKQSTFNGSARQLRGQVLRRLAKGSLTEAALRQQLPDQRLPTILKKLLREGLIASEDGCYHLP